jgi:EpsI family protein
VAAGLSPEGAIPRLIAEHHTEFGWLIFAVLMVPVFCIDWALPGRERGPGDRKLLNRSDSVGRWSGVVIVSCLVLALCINLSYRIAYDGARELPATPVRIAAPGVVGWDRGVDWLDGSFPDFPGASAIAGNWYQSGPAQIGAYVAHFEHQQQGHEVIFASSRPEGRSGIEISGGHAQVESLTGAVLAFNEREILESDASRRLVWYAYRVAGKPAVSDLTAKGLQLVGALRGRHDAQVVVYSARCGTDCGEARSWLAQFAAIATGALYEESARVGITAHNE